ncbi:MAG TPA: translation factor, partial [Planctomycetaceae bacterium]|nr:translation factor [Planctomycetaceae bacterium]
AEQFGNAIRFVVDDGPIPQGAESGATVVSVARDGWSVQRRGIVPESRIAELAGQWFLFVCTGNTCRSPMAAALFRRFLAERLGCREADLPQRGFVALSAGISAAMGAPASREAIAVMRQKGIDLSPHRSQPVTLRLSQQADQIFTMTRTHRDILVATCPEAADRIQVLARDGRDVSDPFGWGTEQYERCEEEIERNVRALVDQLPLAESPER